MQTEMNTRLDEFESVVRERRSTRHFKPDPVPSDLLQRLFEVTRWAPSGYNLQPIHFTAVTSVEVRAGLFTACMKQTQIQEAPCIVVFSGDRRVVPHHLEKMIATERAADAIDDKYEKHIRWLISLSFSHGPVGLGWLWKALLTPVIRLFTPLFGLPAVHKEVWLTRQASLSAMTFMLAAQAAGLSTVPMEGFDAGRLARILNLPSGQLPILVVPVGYTATPDIRKTRLPLEDLLHRDRWHD